MKRIDDPINLPDTVLVTRPTYPWLIQASFIANSILFLVMVFVAAIAWGSHLAAMLSIVATGAALASADQLLAGRALMGKLCAPLSWALGIAALLALVLG